MRTIVVASVVLAMPWLGSGNGMAQTDAAAPSASAALTGAAAYGDWRGDTPGVTRHIAPGDLLKPYATRSTSNAPSVVARPRDATLKVPPGFTVRQFASGLDTPRTLRIAPNGDIFLAESGAGQIRVLRAADGAAAPQRNEVFAGDLDGPFGIAFYPVGGAPQWVYVATTNSVVRYPYRNGDLKARGAAQTVVPRLASEDGHWTRDIAFSPDGKRMFVSVGSDSNDAQGMAKKSPAAIRSWEASHGMGAPWGDEDHRAEILVFDPDGKDEKMFAAGIRNCSGLAVQPKTGDVWCAANERDGLGDNLPPDYVTRVREGAFYGWPWFYIGNHEDPRHKGERPDLAGRVTTPDVLLQPHSAPLQMTFYDPPAAAAAAFPAAYRGDAFVGLHGSWNRGQRTGYKIVRVRLRDGAPTGDYQDFLTGFVIKDDYVWGRPVGVAVAHDGALLVSEDGNGTLWRIAYTGGHQPAE